MQPALTLSHNRLLKAGGPACGVGLRRATDQIPSEILKTASGLLAGLAPSPRHAEGLCSVCRAGLGCTPKTPTVCMCMSFSSTVIQTSAGKCSILRKVVQGYTDLDARKQTLRSRQSSGEFDSATRSGFPQACTLIHPHIRAHTCARAHTHMLSRAFTLI